MNLKTAKRLRRMAHTMAAAQRDEKGRGLPAKRLMVLGSHERRFKQGERNVTAVNDPRTFRGIYRWLKRNYAAS